MAGVHPLRLASDGTAAASLANVADKVIFPAVGPPGEAACRQPGGAKFAGGGGDKGGPEVLL
jgi:hypothetical protein